MAKRADPPARRGGAAASAGRADRHAAVAPRALDAPGVPRSGAAVLPPAAGTRSSLPGTLARARQAAGAPHLRVASYNVHRCVGSDGCYSPSRILEVLAEVDADLIGLQEVDSRSGPHADAFDALAAGSGLHAVAGPNIHTGRGVYGNLLLSRWPPRTVRRLDLSVGRHEPRGALDVDLETPLGRLRLLVLHLGLRVRERRAQMGALRRALAAELAPLTLVMGDFNVAHWRGPDLFGRSGARDGTAPRTFPSRWPLLALDRMQAAPAAMLTAVRAHASPLARRASDHLPLIAELHPPPATASAAR